MESTTTTTPQYLGVDGRYTPPTPSTSLPEDDGMRSLRLKMHEIRNLAASTHEKAQAMHLLMTKDYLAMNDMAFALPEALAPIEAPHAQHAHNDNDNPYNVHAGDLVVTHCPTERQDGEQVLGCAHYSRNVKVQCFDCEQWHPCRHCHDASPTLPFPHQLNRKMTRNMLCMLCETAQPAGPTCTNCGVDTAYYYCPKCKLWDNDSTKSIYHCDDCGICRRGEGLGKDYVHCKRCNVCISISTSNTHPCVERATDCNCPLCLDYLFSSSSPVVSLPCGHYMHAGCYKDLMHVTYRCPVCNKSAVNMELQWRKLDDEIRLQPMPEDEFDDSEAARSGENPTHRRVPRRVFVGCNDCGGRGWADFHWLGLKCAHCDGYNTAQASSQSTETVVPSARPVVQQHEFAGVNALPLVSVEEDRADSAYGCPTSPAQIPIPVPDHAPQQHEQHQRPVLVAHSPPGRSYFLQAEQEESLRNAERAMSASDVLRNAYAERALRAGASASDVLRNAYTERADVLRNAYAEHALRAGDAFRNLPYAERALSAGDAFRNLPYDILQRFSRSLSPMRYYLEGLDVGGARGQAQGQEGNAGPEESDKEERRPRTAASGESFWGEGAGSGLLFGLDFEDDEDDEDEDEDEEDEESDDDESVGSEGEDVYEDDDEGTGFAAEEDDDLQLPGHI